jgi:hypothetical protein
MLKNSLYFGAHLLRHPLPQIPIGTAATMLSMTMMPKKVKTGPMLVASMKYRRDWLMAKLMQEEQMARMTTISPEIY